MSKKFDLEEKINLLYNFCYNKKFPNCYKKEKINYKNISIDDLKIRLSNREVSDELATDIFNGKFRFINYDNEKKLTIIKRYSDQFPVTIFISPYKNESKVDILEDSNNNDSYTSYILSNLVINNLTNHILLPIVSIDVKFNQISDVLNNFNSIDSYIKDIENNKIADLFSIRVKENFFKSDNLESYIKNNVCKMKPVLFQIIHTLAVIQDEFPHFRHNYLKPSNIFLYKKKYIDNITEYKLGKNNYYLFDNDFDIKISNFSYSRIFKENKIKFKKIPFIDKKNSYFDLHYFLNNLLYKNKMNICDNGRRNIC